MEQHFANTPQRMRASPEQFSALVDFMERPQPGAQGRLRADRLWQELTNLLNSMGGGVRSVDKWRKCQLCPCFRLPPATSAAAITVIAIFCSKYSATGVSFTAGYKPPRPRVILGARRNRGQRPFDRATSEFVYRAAAPRLRGSKR
ncbi:hypothetical protein EVAR_90255_1 [Eumeta japonica]|uniref:Regulatory protein zeste n=1 Tax=Eumeta variegata TaxID=151549 RepID=A0A4C1ZZ82_EUMVA|nr:hypothetical protein EVAR_90255_1 [Eumeta japonica]